MSKEALKLALEALEPLVRRAAPWGDMDWLNGCKAITAIKEALAQPDPYKQGYADAMNWKVQNHLEHLPASQKLSKWKLVPKKPTEEMLKAMDECSKEGYDERLYAGHAASVYMAAVDVAPSPPQRKLEQAMRLQKTVERLSLQAGEETEETIDWLCGEHGGMFKLFQAYFSPKSAQRNPLTETEIRTIRRDMAGTLDVQYVAFARAIEAAHNIKEQL